MGSAIKVFLEESRLPTVEAWSAAIKAAGFDLVLDPADLREDDGYLPAMWEGEESGFEWYLAPVADLEVAPPSDTASADIQASLCFTSQAAEDVVSCVAAAVLAKMTGGFYWDAETEAPMHRGDAAILAAQKIVQDWRNRAF
jgi:hypothetical protein